jgi:TolA-binding protein
MQPRKKRNGEGGFMKRTDITGLFPDATAEQINALMDINGADINSAKAGVTDLQTQLATANATIEQLKADAQNVEELTTKANAFETELKELKASNAIRDMREKVSKATGVPASLLTGDTEEACTAQANGIAEFAKPTAYPVIRDGGETGATQVTTPRDAFVNWFNQVSN